MMRETLRPSRRQPPLARRPIERRTRLMRRASCLFVGVLALTGMARAQTPEVATAHAHRISREDIEWLDVWLPHTNDHGLPHVLLIGDSITRGYYPEVEKALAGRAYVGRLSTSKSLGDSALLKEIALILGGGHYQVIHFNNGLHGSGYSEAAYAQALPSVRAVFRRFAPGARGRRHLATPRLEPHSRISD